MKNLIVLIMISIYIVSCTQTNEDILSEFSIIGKWKLTEYCMSPGDITCPKRTPDFDQFFEFGEESRFAYNGNDGIC